MKKQTEDKGVDLWGNEPTVTPPCLNQYILPVNQEQETQPCPKK